MPSSETRKTYASSQSAASSGTRSASAAKTGQTRSSSSSSSRTAQAKNSSASGSGNSQTRTSSSSRSGVSEDTRKAAKTRSSQSRDPSKSSPDKKEAKKKKKKKNKARRKRNRRLALSIIIMILIILVIAGLISYNVRVYDSYEITSSLDISNGTDENEFFQFGSGYIKITENNITYFNKNETIWSETYAMTSPVYDTCKGYIAVADLKQNEVYIYDKEGFVSLVSTENSIIDVEISSAGVIAAATDNDDANYIEVYDKDGNELLTARSVFSSSGYLTDITLSEDGTKLAAAFINVDLQDIVSRVVFYDFSEGDEDSDVVVGGFNQYDNTILTNVEFMDGDKVCAIGDNAITIYDFSGTPEIVYEDLELELTIRSVFFDDSHIGIIADDATGTNNYVYYVYNTSGSIVAEGGFDLSYTKAQFWNKNVVINSSNSILVYTFNGLERFSCAFEENIEAICPIGPRSFIYATTSEIEFIRMKQ